MWYTQHNEASALIDYSYLDYLFEDQEEANAFLNIFVKELTSAKASFWTAIAKHDEEGFRKTYHNVSPHLKLLKISHLSMLLIQARNKILEPKKSFEDREVFMITITSAFDDVIKDINKKLMLTS